ncbi:MAG TPA: type II secretion system minor pseudopilin GspI [Burkholderiaceae bacterium]|nr:type II secretion system minor pseudopilin GspI [Burkholderiaceae bacterium]
MSVLRWQSGFTLVEVLIALVIVSVALLACMRALALATQGNHDMRVRSLALLAAENRLSELRLLRAFPVAGRRTEPCPQGSLALICEQVFQNTVNSSFRQVTIRVREGEGPVLAELGGLLSPLP